MEPDAAAPRRGAFASLRHRDFATYWSANLVSNSGTWMQYVTVPYVLDQLTHSTAWVGFGAFLTFFPTVLVAPLAGSLADHYSRRRIIISTQLLMMAMTAALAALWISGHATPGTIVACVAAGSLAQGLNNPAAVSLGPTLVPREHIVNAVRLNTMSVTAARALGPGSAGLVLALLGPGAAFVINTGSFLAVIAAMAVIPERHVHRDEHRPRLGAHLGEALRYVRSKTSVMLPILLTGTYMLLGGASVQLFEPFVRHIFDGSAGRYGLLTGVYGIGGLTGSMLLLFHGDRVRRSTSVMLALSIFVVVEIAFGAAPGYWYGIAAAALMGVAHVLTGVTLLTAIHDNVPDEQRGRVSSIYQCAFLGGVPVGALVMGLLAGPIGLRATFIGAGALLGVALIVVVVRSGRLRVIDQHLEDEPGVASSSERVRTTGTATRGR